MEEGGKAEERERKGRRKREEGWKEEGGRREVRGRKRRRKRDEGKTK